MALKYPSSFSTFLLMFLLLGIANSFNEINEELLEDVFKALDKLLDFFYRDYQTINLDGIFGLRVAQGAFLSIINSAQDGQLRIGKDKLGKVKQLYHRATLTAKKALPFLEKSSPDYFKKFKTQVSMPWLNFKPFTNKMLKKRQFSNRDTRRNAVSFDEDTSDQCMSELTGTTDGSESLPCLITDKCWYLISAEGTWGYTLTHQALFLLVGEIIGCTPVLLKRLEQSNIKGGLEELYGRICSDMYPQMMEIERKRTVVYSTYQQDLYMEQAMVCGSIGFPDFLSPERLRVVLGWQRSDGCFGERVVNQNDIKKVSSLSEEQKRTAEVVDEMDNAREGGRAYEGFKNSLEYNSFSSRKTLTMRTMRALLLEKKLDDGCMSHVTGVATGLLGVYVRWLLYPHGHGQMSMQLDSPLDIKKELSLGHVQNAEQDMQTSDELVDIIQQKAKQYKRQSHLIQMRKAAMLRNSAQGLFVQGEEREVSTGFLRWKVVLFACVLLSLGSILLIGRLGSNMKWGRHKKNLHIY